MKGNTQLRQESLKKVLTEIRVNGPISKRELQSITGFSWGNISSIITLLCDRGFIAPIGKQDTGLGRKPEKYDINIDDNYIIGVDFNCTGVLAAVCDLRGRIVASFKEEFKELNRESAEKQLYKAVNDALDFSKGKNVTHIAVAMQGDVDSTLGVSIKLNINDWENVPVCQLLSEKFGKKTVMLHDPDCILYAERFYGALAKSKADNAAVIRIDHGLGLAVLLGNKIYMGNKGKTCEIKDIIIPSENDGYTTLNNVLGSVFVIREKYEKMTGKTKKVKEIAELARRGEKAAVTIFDELTLSLAFAVNLLTYLFNTEKIIIFGEFKNNADLFLDKLRALSESFIKNAAVPEIVISSLEDDAAAVGAALFAADNLVEQLYFEK